MDIVVAASRDAIMMVEGEMHELQEDVVIDALLFAHQAVQPLIELQERMAAEVGKAKRAYTPYKIDEALQKSVDERAQAQLDQAMDQPYEKAARYDALNEMRTAVVAELAGEDEALAAQVAEAFEQSFITIVHSRILERGVRPDGRGLTEIRPIWCEVDVSPRAHGGLGRSARTAHARSEPLGSATITHPYHPLRTQQFPILKTRRVGGVETLILKVTAGGTFTVPLAWTDRGEPSPWEILGKNPPRLAISRLWALVGLLDSLRRQDDAEGES